MAVSLQCRRTKDGTKYFTASVRVNAYPSASRTFSTRKDAVDWARADERELKRQAEQRIVRCDVSRMTVGQLAAEYLGDPTTQQLGYHGDLCSMLAWWSAHCGSDRIMEFGVVQIREARDILRKGGHGGRTPARVNRYLSALRSAWNWGRDAGLVPQERTWPDRVLFTEPKGRVRYLADADLKAVLEAAAALSSTIHAAIVVSLGCGIRSSELLRLKWADIDLDRQQLRIAKAKNVGADGETRSRSVYLPALVVSALRELRKAPVVGQHVVCDEAGQSVTKGWLKHRWELVRAAAKLQDFRWHDLRHSCASFLAQSGANLLEIGSVLGHKSVATTLRYAHLVDAKPVTDRAGLEAKLKGGA
jgi:integrase